MLTRQRAYVALALVAMGLTSFVVGWRVVADSPPSTQGSVASPARGNPGPIDPQPGSREAAAPGSAAPAGFVGTAAEAEAAGLQVIRTEAAAFVPGTWAQLADITSVRPRSACCR